MTCRWNGTHNLREKKITVLSVTGASEAGIRFMFKKCAASLLDALFGVQGSTEKHGDFRPICNKAINNLTTMLFWS